MSQAETYPEAYPPVSVDRPHDLGGRDGFGPVPVDADRAWSAHWQQLAQVLASLTARAAGVNGDALRDVMERLPAQDYQRLGPCGRWLAVAERCAVEGGLIAEGEVMDRARCRAARQESPPVEQYPEPGPSRFHGRVPPHHKRDPTEAPDPHFQVGDAVRVTFQRPVGHTRLPGYLRGHRGKVVALNGFWVFPDRHAVDGTEAPTWVYAVRFAAADLWPGAGTHEVCADLFEPYLEATNG